MQAMKLTVWMMLALLTGCAMNGRAIDRIPDPVVIDTACKWVNVILVSKSDEFTPETARQIYSHNVAVKRNCGEPSK